MEASQNRNAWSRIPPAKHKNYKTKSYTYIYTKNECTMIQQLIIREMDKRLMDKRSVDKRLMSIKYGTHSSSSMSIADPWTPSS